MKKSENHAARNCRDPARLVFRNFDEKGLYKVRDVESRIFHTEVINSYLVFIQINNLIDLIHTLAKLDISYAVGWSL